MREETRHRHYIGYVFPIAARAPLYTLSHRLDSTCHGLCYTNGGWNEKYFNGLTMKYRSDDLSHHKRTLYHGATSNKESTCFIQVRNNGSPSADHTTYIRFRQQLYSLERQWRIAYAIVMFPKHACLRSFFFFLFSFFFSLSCDWPAYILTLYQKNSTTGITKSVWCTQNPVCGMVHIK